MGVTLPHRLRGFQRIANCQQDAFSICQHVIVPEPHDAIAFLREPCIASFVVIRMNGVLSTIHFDHQPDVKTREVDDVSSDRNLPPETVSIDLPVAEMSPQRLLRIGHRLAQATRVRIDQIRNSAANWR